MKKIYNNELKYMLIVFLSATLLLASCKKDAPVAHVPEISSTKGIYMLCEGNWSKANSAISYYDIATGTVEADMYKKVNGTALGESANDLQAYGSKMYCVVTGIEGKTQSFVDVLDVATCKLLKRIPFNNAADGYMPRFVTFYKNKAYVSRYDGKISRIDTGSLAVDFELQLMNGTSKAGGLEGLAVANGKLYVANSAHPSNQSGVKSKVSVIDLATFTKTKDIEVGQNPVRIAATSNGDLYTVTWTDYSAATFNNPTLVRINSTTDAVVQTESYDLGTIAILKDVAYVAKDIYVTPDIKLLNTTTGKVGASLITDGTAISSIYGITINPFDGSVVVADANNYATTGKAFVFGTDGKKKNSFVTSALPQHAVFNYNYK